MNSKDETTLEQLIDAYGIHGVLRSIGEIAYSKANNIRESYQDETLAKQWERDAYKVLDCRVSQPEND